MTDATFLTADELVTRWGGTVRKPTLEKWRTLGKGPKYVKAGGRVLYRLADVEAYERENTRQKTKGGA